MIDLSNPTVQFVSIIVAGAFSLACATAWLTWWLGEQFSRVRHLVHSRIEQMEAALEEKVQYHEAHDDDRFKDTSQRIGRLRDELWQLRLEHAIATQRPSPTKPPEFD